MNFLKNTFIALKQLFLKLEVMSAGYKIIKYSGDKNNNCFKINKWNINYEL